MNNELTIIVPIKNRSQFTLRWLKYQNQNPNPFPVIIADSSKDDTIEKILRNRSRYPHINYEYIKFPETKDPVYDLTNLNEKIYESLLHVKTKYVTLAGDDDFRLKDGLIKAVNFLNDNPDYIASRGEIYDFEVRSIGKSGDEESVYGKMTSLNRIYTNDSNIENAALERARKFFEYSNSLWFDVCRSDTLRKCYQILVDSKIVDFNIALKFLDCLLVAQGKVHRGSGLYMLHQSHKSGLGNELGKKDPFEWIMSPTWSTDVSNMFKHTAEQISKIDKIPLELAHGRIMQYFICFFVGKSIIAGRLKRKNLQTLPTFFMIGRIFDKKNKIRIFFKKFYLYLKDYKQNIRSDKFIKASPYHEEIEAIQNFLIKNAK